MKPAPLRTPEEVATRLQIKLTTVWALARTRTLIGVKVGPYWRFEDAEIDAYIARQRQGPSAQALPPALNVMATVGLHALPVIKPEDRRFS